MSGEDTATISLQEALTMQLDEMELLETAYPEITFDTPDPRPSMLTALAQAEPADQHGREVARQEDKRRQDSWLEDALATVPLLSFRCPLSRDAQLRVRLPRRYPEDELEVTVEGTPQLSAVSRRGIAAAATAAATGGLGEGQASGLSGRRRREPQCLQVLGEAMRTSDDLAERESAGGSPSPLSAGASAAGGGRGGASDISSVSANYSATANGPRSTNREGSTGVAARSIAAVGSGGIDTPRRSSASEEGEESGDAPGGARRKKQSKQSGTREQQQRRQEPSPPGPGGAGSARKEGEKTVAILGRRLIYSHHIIAQQKRTGVVKTARELGLGGFSKIGWPGVIVVEGEEACCEEFVATLRRWRWKHLAVRGEETLAVPEGATVDDERRLPLPFAELGEKEGGVSAVAKRCRELGLGELFATLLR